LDQLFGAGAGASAAPGGGTIRARLSPALLAALQAARQDYVAAGQALAKSPPDWSAYGVDEAKLGQALKEIAALTGGGRQR
jgi:hypothetical protein